MSHTIRPNNARVRLNRVLLIAFCLFALTAGAVSLFAPKARAAATWHVSVGNPGACTTADRNCATIKGAVSNASPGDTIIVAAGTYNEHDIIIDYDLTINGAGANTTIVDGQQLGRIFGLAEATINISGLTIRNGKTADGFSFGEGGSPGEDGGGIRSESAVVTITSCAIINNATGNGGPVFSFSDAPETLKGTPKVTFVPSGGDGGYGGGIYNCLGGNMKLVNSTVSGNHTGVGGSGGGTGNAGFGGEGGGIFNAATLTVLNSTVANNSTGAGGSTAILAAPEVNGAMENSGTPNLVEPLVGGNGGEGGGIANDEAGTVNLSNSTIAFNQTGAGASGGVGGNGGGVYTGATGTILNVISTIIAKNSVGAGGTGPDVFSDTAVGDGGFNLIGKTDGSSGFTQATTQKGTIASPLDPKFAAAGLANNGGPTNTIALQSTSPAVDKGKKEKTLTTDQRGAGFPRIADFPAITNASDGCDVGAFELPVPPDPCATDTTPPVITCPGSITRNATPGQLGAFINPGSPVASDNCSLKSVTGFRSDGKALNALYPIGTTIITWIALDAKNNAKSCSQTIIVMEPGADVRKVTP